MSEVEIAADAAENLEALPSRERQVVLDALERVRDDPREHLEPADEEYLEMQIGEYVAIFTLEEEGEHIHLWTLGKRADPA